MNIQNGQDVTFTYRGQQFTGKVGVKNGTHVVEVGDYEIGLNELLTSLREDNSNEKLNGFAKTAIETVAGNLDAEKVLKNPSAVDAAATIVKKAKETTDDSEIKTADENALKDAASNALKAKEIEQKSSDGTMGNVDAAVNVLNQYQETKTSLFNDYLEPRPLDIALDRAREVMGNEISGIYEDLDMGDIAPEDAMVALVDGGVSKEDASLIISEATGLEKDELQALVESIVDTDAEYLDSEGNTLDEEPDFADSDNDSLGLPSDKKEEAVEIARELFDRGMNEVDVAEYIELEYEVSRDEAAAIAQVAMNDLDVEEPSNDLDQDTVTDTIERMNEADELNDVLVGSGVDITDEWDDRFESAIDDFEKSDEPYEDDDLYDYLYQKFEVPEDTAADILQQADMNVPQAVVLLCEHCKKVLHN
jgi:hypothetical protein